MAGKRHVGGHAILSETRVAPSMKPASALAATVLLLVLAAAPTSAQMSFNQPYQLRGAVGDIPTTDFPEPAGSWNIEQRIQVTTSGHNGAPVFIDYPAQSKVLRMSCTCGVTGYDDGDHAIFNLTSTLPDATYTIVVTTAQGIGGSASWGFSVIPFPSNLAPADRVAILYIPNGAAVTGPVAESQDALNCAGGLQCSIHVFGGSAASPLPAGTLWFSIHPTTAAEPVVTTTVTAPGGAASTNWLFIGVAFLAGLIVWALLVSRGMVQRKSRKQVATTAAHVEAAQAEPLTVLEGRKRALMAALKEIELARQANEIDVPTYDTLKAELKKEAVTVMRAIDESGAKKA